MGIPDETTDVVLEVEGRELHANRAVLAHYSPVFGKIFFSDFKEKDQSKVPLPGKSYDEMANFFNVLYPQTPTSPGLIKGNGVLDRILPVHNALELLMSGSGVGSEGSRFKHELMKSHTSEVAIT